MITRDNRSINRQDLQDQQDERSFLTIMYILLILSIFFPDSSFRLRFKRQIRLRIKRAIAGSDIDSQRQ